MRLEKPSLLLISLIIALVLYQHTPGHSLGKNCIAYHIYDIFIFWSDYLCVVFKMHKFKLIYMVFGTIKWHLILVLDQNMYVVFLNSF